jgi:hypothetical protein
MSNAPSNHGPFGAKGSGSIASSDEIPPSGAYCTDSPLTEQDYYTLATEAVRSWEAKLKVDEQDPFFFDHPLDHVPGTLLLFGLLDVVRIAAGPRIGIAKTCRIRLDVAFSTFCELGREVRLLCTEVASPEMGDLSSRSWRLRAQQDGSDVCTGILRVSREPNPLFANRGRGDERRRKSAVNGVRLKPAIGSAVHRENPENIIIGKPETDDRGSVCATVMSPGPGQLKSRSPDGERGLEEVIEAARQFSVLLEEMSKHKLGETQLIMHTLRADFPGGLTRDPLMLRQAKTERKGSRTLHVIELLESSRTETIGEFVITGWNVSKKAYSRMRGFKK